MAQLDRLSLRPRDKECPLSLGVEPVPLWARVLVQEVVALECLLEAHDRKPCFRVLREVWPCQYGSRQFLLLERWPTLYELYRDLYGTPPKRAAAEEVSVSRSWCA